MTCAPNGPVAPIAISTAPSLVVLVSLRSRTNISLRLKRLEKSSPVTAFNGPRSMMSEILYPPTVSCPTSSGNHTLRTQVSKPISLRVFMSSSSSSPRSLTTQPINPVSMLNRGIPTEPATTHVAAIVPTNSFVASALPCPFIGLIMRLKFLAKNDAMYSGNIMNCNDTLPSGLRIIGGRLLELMLPTPS